MMLITIWVLSMYNDKLVCVKKWLGLCQVLAPWLWNGIKRQFGAFLEQRLTKKILEKANNLSGGYNSNRVWKMINSNNLFFPVSPGKTKGVLREVKNSGKKIIWPWPDSRSAKSTFSGFHVYLKERSQVCLYPGTTASGRLFQNSQLIQMIVFAA